MKVILILTFLISNLTYAHTDKMVKKSYGNIHVTTYASDYVEEMNKTLIIAQYAENLSKELGYSNNIYLLFSEEQLDPPSIFSWLPDADGSPETDGIHVMFRYKSFNIIGCLNVIENSILNSSNLDEFDGMHIGIYNNEISPVINKILSKKIYRPNVMEELNKSDLYSYYVFNGEYNIFKNEEGKEKIIDIIDNVLYYKVLSFNMVIVFDNIDNFSIYEDEAAVRKGYIEEPPNFYWPYKTHLSGNNKVIIEFFWLSEQKNRIMVYYLEKNLLIQDLDKALGI